MEKQSDPDKNQEPSQNSDFGKMRKFGLFSVIIGELVGFTGAGIGLGYWRGLSGAPRGGCSCFRVLQV